MRSEKKLISWAGSLALVVFSVSITAHAAIGVPKADLWEMWDASNETNLTQIDHGAWQVILDVYLDDKHPSAINRFNYAAITPADLVVLDNYILDLAALDPRVFNRLEQRAYWINLYNALTVQIVIRNYPVTSIRKINGGLFNLGPWGDDIFVVQQQELSLNDIEHRILRPIWKDSRIHYAVNCASLGCPNLAAKAYTAANTEALLDSGARAYINHPRGVKFEGDRLILSRIYDWYGADFGDTQAELLEHLASYARADLATGLRSYTAKLRYQYDWVLNAP